MGLTKEEIKKQKDERLGLEKYNYQGCLMKIVEYSGYNNITVEFQDHYKCLVKTRYQEFRSGKIKNPYHKCVFNVGMIGSKYKTRNAKGKQIKEYNTWAQMLKRCYDEKSASKNKTYEEVYVCDEWFLFENFYEWLHSQNNFEKWLNNHEFAIDKDILFKGNKIYSPDTCCLVPRIVNNIFTKRESLRGNLPIGVCKKGNRYAAQMDNKKNTVRLGYFDTKYEAFNAYKTIKENYIKQIAKEEFDKCNITQKCYEAMVNYQVEIDD